MYRDGRGVGITGINAMCVVLQRCVLLLGVWGVWSPRNIIAYYTL